jgi:hypothetical protein
MTKSPRELSEWKRYAWEKPNAFFTNVPDMIKNINPGIDPNLSTEAYPMTSASIIQNMKELEFVAHCPTTGKWVIGHISSHYNDLGLEATWWECPVCHGCHVSFNVSADHHEEAVLT